MKLEAANLVPDFLNQVENLWHGGQVGGHAQVRLLLQHRPEKPRGQRVRLSGQKSRLQGKLDDGGRFGICKSCEIMNKVLTA